MRVYLPAAEEAINTVNRLEKIAATKGLSPLKERDLRVARKSVEDIRCCILLWKPIDQKKYPGLFALRQEAIKAAIRADKKMCRVPQ